MARYVYKTKPKWLRHKHRVVLFSPLLASPVAYDVNFTIPTFMRMKLVSTSGSCTFTLKYRGITTTYTLASGKEKVIECVWQNTEMVCPKNGQILIDLGQHISTWGLIAGVDKPIVKSGYGYGAYGTSGYGD